jgi:IS30 family transposase
LARSILPWQREILLASATIPRRAQRADRSRGPCQDSLGERVQRAHPDAKVVKAFNSAAIASKLGKHWSPAQISRWLRRRWPQRTDWHLCHETIYEAVYRGLVVAPGRQILLAWCCGLAPG